MLYLYRILNIKVNEEVQCQITQVFRGQNVLNVDKYEPSFFLSVCVFRLSGEIISFISYYFIPSLSLSYIYAFLSFLHTIFHPIYNSLPFFALSLSFFHLIYSKTCAV